MGGRSSCMLGRPALGQVPSEAQHDRKLKTNPIERYMIPNLLVSTPLAATKQPLAEEPKRILIIGGGVTGLTTCAELLDRGYKVTVVAREYASNDKRITSQIAGALWEWPPAVCGKHTDDISLKNSKRWCMVAYHRFDAMSQDPVLREEAGVRMRFANFFFKKRIENIPGQASKMDEFATCGAEGFRRDPLLIKECGINEDYGVVDAYRHLAPIIDTDRYMQWIRAYVAARGAKLCEGSVKGDLVAQERELLNQYQAGAIINCTGLAGGSLCDDETCYPLRGALVRLKNDGSRFPQLTQAMSISLDGREGTGENDLVFIVPRNDNTLIIGGMAEPNEWSLDINMENYPKIRKMLEWNQEFYPPLKNAEIDPEYPIAVGLRPFRKCNVRCERDPRVGLHGMQSLVFHSYGQGGAGFSLSWGCARDIADVVDAALLHPRGMP